MSELPEHLKCFEDYFYDANHTLPAFHAPPESPTEATTEQLQKILIAEEPAFPLPNIALWRRCAQTARETRAVLTSRVLKPYAVQLALGGAAVVAGIAGAFLSPHETGTPPEAQPRVEQPSNVPSASQSAPAPVRQPVTKHLTSPSGAALHELAWATPMVTSENMPSWRAAPSEPPVIPETDSTSPSASTSPSWPWPTPPHTSESASPTSVPTPPLLPSISQTESASASADPGEAPSNLTPPPEPFASMTAAETPPASGLPVPGD